MISRSEARAWVAKTLSVYWAREKSGMLGMAKTQRKELIEALVDEIMATKGVCPMTGIVYAWDNAKKRYNSPSIGRKNASVGYVAGNVRITSHAWNRIKGELFDDEARKLIRGIVRHLNGN